MTMTAWIEFICDHLHSLYSKKQVRDIIVNQCVRGRVYGTYIVDGNKVWEMVVKTDSNCLKWAENRRIENAIEAESWYEERHYQDMKATYPRKRRRKV